MRFFTTKNKEKHEIPETIQREPHPDPQEYQLNILLHSRYKTLESAVDLGGLTDPQKACHRLAQEIELTRRLICGVMQEQRRLATRVEEIHDETKKEFESIQESMSVMADQANQTNKDLLKVKDDMRTIDSKQAALRELLKRAAVAHNAGVLNDRIPGGIVVPPEVPRYQPPEEPKIDPLPRDEDGHLDTSGLRATGMPNFQLDGPWIRQLERVQKNLKEESDWRQKKAAFQEMLATVPLGPSGVATLSASIMKVVDDLRMVRSDDVQVLLRNKNLMEDTVENLEHLPGSIGAMFWDEGLGPYTKVSNAVYGFAKKLGRIFPLAALATRELDEQVEVANAIADAVSPPETASTSTSTAVNTTPEPSAPDSGVYEISLDLACDKPVDELTEAEAKAIIRALPLHVAFDTRTHKVTSDADEDSTSVQATPLLVHVDGVRTGGPNRAARTSTPAAMNRENSALPTVGRGISRQGTMRAIGVPAAGTSMQHAANAAAGPSQPRVEQLTPSEVEVEATITHSRYQEEAGPSRVDEIAAPSEKRKTGRTRASTKGKGKQRAVEVEDAPEANVGVKEEKKPKTARATGKRKAKQQILPKTEELGDPVVVPSAEPAPAATKGKKRARDEVETGDAEVGVGGRKAASKRRKQ